MAWPTITEKKKNIIKTKGIWAENAKTEPLRLGFGCADGKGDGR
jgi:hypothetical protein